jgi:hypothetical protein
VRPTCEINGIFGVFGFVPLNVKTKGGNARLFTVLDWRRFLANCHVEIIKIVVLQWHLDMAI